MESTEAESTISVCIGRCKKAGKGRSSGRTRLEQRQLLNFFMKLQLQQDVILIQIETKTFEEDENEGDFIVVHKNSTSDYHDFINRDGNSFIFGHEVCTVVHSRKCLLVQNNSSIG